MTPEKVHIRHCMLMLFNLQKTPAETKRLIEEAYGNGVISVATCERWFQRFKSGDFDLKDKKRVGRPVEMKTDYLEMLLKEDPAQSTNILAKQLGVSKVGVWKRLKRLGKTQKEGKWVNAGSVGKS